MTVSYNSEVATSSFLCFWRLLFRWRGSLFKLLWKDLLLFVLCYLAIFVIYHFWLDCHHQPIFYTVSKYCSEYIFEIPLTFVLAFFVSLVLQRWWEQVMLLPFPDSLAFQVTGNLLGHDPHGRLIRRTIVRYMNLSYVMKLSSMCPPVKKRFPTDRHLIESGLMTEDEAKLVREHELEQPPYFLPVMWSLAISNQAYKEKRIESIYALHTVLDALLMFRGRLGSTGYYDWINIPLVYVQVVSVAIHFYFLAHLFGQHVLEVECIEGDRNSTANATIQTSSAHPAQSSLSELEDRFQLIIKPLFVVFQFIFFMGWLKVAESLVNPFGEDDDDLEVNWMIDRNIRLSYLMVDELHAEHPELVKDQQWDDPQGDLPVTKAMAQIEREPFRGSAADVVVPPEQTAWILQLETIMEEQKETQQRESESSKTSGINKNKNSRNENLEEKIKVTDELEEECVGSSSSLSEDLNEKIPAVIVTKKEIEKGKLVRAKGMPDPSARLALPTMIPRHLVLKNKPEVFHSDSIGSLAARMHRKDLETQVKRSATRRDGDQSDDHLSQSSAPSGKAFLFNRLHQSLQTQNQKTSTPETSLQDLVPDSTKERLVKSSRDDHVMQGRRNVKGNQAAYSKSNSHSRRTNFLTPSSSYSSIFHMSDLTSLNSVNSSQKFDARFLELNHLTQASRPVPRKTKVKVQRRSKGHIRSTSESLEVTEVKDRTQAAETAPPREEYSATSVDKDQASPDNSQVSPPLYFADESQPTITGGPPNLHPSLRDICFDKNLQTET